jgi:hypothetical protein
VAQKEGGDEEEESCGVGHFLDFNGGILRVPLSFFKRVFFLFLYAVVNETALVYIEGRRLMRCPFMFPAKYMALLFGI